MLKFSLENKVAIVTGGGSGIGKEIAITIAGQGALIHILDLNSKAVMETVNEVKKMGCFALILNHSFWSSVSNNTNLNLSA